MPISIAVGLKVPEVQEKQIDINMFKPCRSAYPRHESTGKANAYQIANDDATEMSKKAGPGKDDRRQQQGTKRSHYHWQLGQA